MAFVIAQSEKNVARFLNDPSLLLVREIKEMGPRTATRLFDHQAVYLNRHLRESWDFLQLGLGAALVVVSFLTIRHKRLQIAAAIAMFLIAAVFALYLTPTINSLGYSLSELPAETASGDRDALIVYELSRSSLDVAKTSLGLLLSFLFIRQPARREPVKLRRKTSSVSAKHRQSDLPVHLG